MYVSGDKVSPRAETFLRTLGQGPFEVLAVVSMGEQVGEGLQLLRLNLPGGSMAAFPASAFEKVDTTA